MRLQIIVFICFILSAIASVSYQLLWLRLSFSYFGTVVYVVSGLISIFMLGLMIGTMAAPIVLRNRSGNWALKIYAIVEILTGALAFLTPYIFQFWYQIFISIKSADSATYIALSSLAMLVTILPPCILMGATFPIMMHYVKNLRNRQYFGYLYCANLLGALLGCLLPLVLIEIFGLHEALNFIVFINLAAGLLALAATFSKKAPKSVHEKKVAKLDSKNVGRLSKPAIFLLFATGFIILGSEILWIKSFVIVLGTTVYAFASTLFVYLLASFAGNSIYLLGSKSNEQLSKVLYLLAPAALIPLFFNSGILLDRIGAYSILSIIPVSLLLGYITPCVIDNISLGNVRLMTKAYTLNFLGCTLGPLFTTYILFPAIGTRYSYIAYAILLALAIIYYARPKKVYYEFLAGLLLVVLTIGSLILPNYEDFIKSEGILHRDLVGTVGAYGKDMNKHLEVNGVGMTSLTTITKNMVHLPLVQHPNAKNALIICFGMGTTLRSAASWPLENIEVAELSRGVVESFPYFHNDTANILADKRVHVTIDDGRRYLNRSDKKYDLIVIDPPPPMTSATSGLLYSADFIKIINGKLNDDGILAHWVPGDDNGFLTSTIIDAIKQNFKYVQIYSSIENWGVHILASNKPLIDMDPKKYVKIMPVTARSDEMEWQPGKTIQQVAADSLHRLPLDYFDKYNPKHLAISDDCLYNEFFLLRNILPSKCNSEHAR